jgi:hypothetical protein
MAAHIVPLPLWARKLPRHLRPGHPPIFDSSPPSAEDIREARSLIRALDPESRAWYGTPASLRRRWKS